MRAHRFFLPVVMMLASGIAVTSKSDELPAGRAETLTNLVRQDCGSCHGLTLRGGLGHPITSSALEGVDIKTVRNIVLNGLPGTAMPSWAGLLTEREAEWIASGLKEGRFQ